MSNKYNSNSEKLEMKWTDAVMEFFQEWVMKNMIKCSQEGHRTSGGGCCVIRSEHVVQEVLNDNELMANLEAV